MENEKLNKINRINSIIAMLESEQDESLAEGSDLEMEIAKVLEDAMARLTKVKEDVVNDEFYF